MRKERRNLLLAGLVAVAVVAVIAWQLGLNAWGPWYHGKPLRSWLEEYGTGPGSYKPSPKADAALRQIGTNAVPFLLRLLHATNSTATAKALANPPSGGWNWTVITTNISLKVRVMTWVEAHTPIRFHPTRAPASWRHWQAYLGFQALGPLGRAAIPELVKLAQDPSDNSNPSGTGMAPNVAFWKDTGMVAVMADQSSTYLAPGQTLLRGTLGRNVILVDGEIAAWSLATIGADSVPPLLAMLTDPHPRVRCRAAVALGLIGAAAEPAVPALVKMLDDPDINTRWEAADALGCIGRRPDLAVPALTAALADPNVGMKFTAMGSLGDFRERATNAIPALLAFVEGREGDYRLKEYAAASLGKISRETTAKTVMPVVLHDLRDPREGIRNGAVMALGEMKDEPELAIPALIGALDDTNQNVRINAIWELGRFGPAGKAAIPALMASLTDPVPLVRTNAAKALKAIDPEAAAKAGVK